MFGMKKLLVKAEAPSSPAPASDTPSENDEMTRAKMANSDDEARDAEDLAPTSTVVTQDLVYPSGLKLGLIIASAFSSLFLVSLDRLIISTAIPEITNEFKAVDDIGWYGSAYLLTTCAFQLWFGKFYTFFSAKLVFLVAILLFEVGSALCGAAPDSTSFIVGRAIAGLGSAGIMSGVLTVIVYSVPLHRRPLFQGMFGAVFGVASVIGPLLGGVFTSKITWRWCFYINLPFGGIAMAFIFLLLDIPDRPATRKPLGEKLAQLDALGISLLIPGTVCVLLALQWGGLTYAWSNSRVITCLVLGAVLLIGFVAVQILKPDTATVPPRIFMQRSIVSGVGVTFFLGSSMMVFVYYLPIWFQAIQGLSAVDSGVRLLPMVLPMVAASIGNGIVVSKTGYYTPSMIIGTVLFAVGAGLLTTLQVDSSENKWIGYQVIYGFGIGLTFQGPNLAAQTVLPRQDVPVGTSLMFFTQLFGGAIFTSVGQSVLNGQLAKRLAAVIPNFKPSSLESTGATALIAEAGPTLHSAVIVAYNESLRRVFWVGMILSCLVVIGVCTMEWKSVKKHVQKESADEEAGAAGAAAAAGPAEEGKIATDMVPTTASDSEGYEAEDKQHDIDEKRRRSSGDKVEMNAAVDGEDAKKKDDVVAT